MNCINKNMSEMILRCIKENPMCTSNQVAEFLGIPHLESLTLINKLQKDGKISMRISTLSYDNNNSCRYILR